MKNKNKALIAIIVGALLAGATSSITKIGLFQIQPLTFAFTRFFIATLLISPLILKNKRVIKKDFISLLPFSTLASINIILFALGIKLTTATIGQLLYIGVPLLTALFGYLLFKQRITALKIIGIFLGFIGVATVILLPIIEKGYSYSGNLEGNILIVMGGLFFSLYMVYSPKLQKSYSPFELTAHFILTTTIILLPFYLFESVNNPNLWKGLHLSSVLSVVYMATFATVGTYLLNQYAVKHGGALFASLNIYLIPIFSFVFAFLLLGELLTPGIIIGGTLAILGVFLVMSK